MSGHESGGRGRWRNRARATVALALLLSLFATTVLADGDRPVEKKYPPYPDVWGRALAVPEEAEPGQSVFLAPDGDVLIRYSWWPGGCREGASPEASTQTFFGGVIRKIDWAEADRILNAARAGGPYKRAMLDHVVLKGGDVVDFRAVIGGGRRCNPLYDSTLYRQDPGKYYGEYRPRFTTAVRIERIPLQLLKRPRRHHIWEYCNIAGGKDHYHTYLQLLSGLMVPLEDGTFLVPSSGYVIRYRPDLTSPFVDQRRELFLVDADHIRMLGEAADKRPASQIQNANDAIRDYLIPIRRGQSMGKR